MDPFQPLQLFSFRSGPRASQSGSAAARTDRSLENRLSLLTTHAGRHDQNCSGRKPNGYEEDVSWGSLEQLQMLLALRARPAPIPGIALF